MANKIRKLKIDELNRISTEEFKRTEKNPVTIVLDNIRSMHNIGSAFRTADAFLVEKIYLCGITATPPNKEIHKTALGATDSVEWEYVEDTERAVVNLKEDGYLIVSVEQAEGSVSLYNFHHPENTKLALVFGNEVRGVDQGIINLSNACIEIPQFGTKHSLNISVSVGIVLWEILKPFIKGRM